MIFILFVDDGKSTTIFDFFNHKYVKTRFQNKIENDFFNKLFDFVH